MAYDLQGARAAGVSDSDIADHLAKKYGYRIGDARQAGVSDADIISHLMSKEAMPQDDSNEPTVQQSQPQPQDGQNNDVQKNGEKSTSGEIMRGLSRGTRSALEGLGEFPDLFNQAINGVVKGTTGYDLGLRNPGAVVSDWLGLEKPESDAEKLEHEGLKAGTALITPAGWAKVGANAGIKGFNWLYNTLKAKPIQQLIGGVMSGVSSEAARQADASAPIQIAAGLAGGMAPGSIEAALRAGGNGLKSLNNLVNLTTDNGIRSAAGKVASDTGLTADTLRQANDDYWTRFAHRTAPETSPTVGQLANNPRYSSLERGLAQAEPDGGLNAVYNAQADALAADNNAVLGKISDRVDRYSKATHDRLDPGISASEAGGTIRDEYDKVRAGREATSHSMYDSVTPDPDTPSFDVSGLPKMVEGVNLSDPDSADYLSRALGVFAKQGNKASFNQLQRLRSDLGTRAATTKNGANPDAFKEASLLRLKDSVNDMLTAPKSQGGALSRGQRQALSDADTYYRNMRQDLSKGRNDKLWESTTKTGNGSRVTDDEVAKGYFPNGGGKEASADFSLWATPEASQARDAYAKSLYAAKSGDAKSRAGFLSGYKDSIDSSPALRSYLDRMESLLSTEGKKLEGLKALAGKPDVNGDFQLRKGIDLNGANGERFLGRNGGANIMNQGELTRLRENQALAEMRQRNLDAGKAYGSDTAKNEATKRLMESVFGKRNAPTSRKGWVANKISGAANIADTFLTRWGLNPVKNSSDKVAQLLREASMDPNKMIALLNEAKKFPTSPDWKSIVTALKSTAGPSFGLVSKFIIDDNNE